MGHEENNEAEKKQRALDWALLLAAYGGHTDVVKALLDAGADVHAGNEHALEVAAIHGHTDTARVLLSAGANPRDESGPVAAWRLAASNGHRETVKAILDWTDQHPSVPKGGQSPHP